MRYRRYYTTKHSDGSRSVVSYGPLGALCVFMGKVFAVMIVLGWPLGITDFVHGWPGWVLAIPIEILWLIIIITYGGMGQKGK